MESNFLHTEPQVIFDQLEPVDQEFFLNDFEPVRFRDRHHDTKEHIFKRENGRLFYAQVFAYGNDLDNAVEDGFPLNPPYTYIYTREDGKHGFTTAYHLESGKDSHGYLPHFLEHLKADRKRHYKRGQFLHHWCNQAYRDAEVLVVDAEKRLALCEFEMPNGTTALFVIDSYTGEGRRCRFSYRRLPKRWAKLMEEQKVRWIGQSQGSSEPVPLPY